jgi:hypothetical protein
MALKFYAASLNRKYNDIACIGIILVLKIVPKAASEFLFWLPVSGISPVPPCHWMHEKICQYAGCFWNNIQNHRVNKRYFRVLDD